MIFYGIAASVTGEHEWLVESVGNLAVSEAD
jgi:hypothetical protein